MSTAYATALFNSKVGTSSGHGLNRMSSHLHAISPTISTWATGDTITVGNLPRQAIVTNVVLKAAGQLDSNGAPTLTLDVGVASSAQLFKAAISTIGRAAGASVDTTNTPAGYLYQNTSGADQAVVITVHAGAASPAAGTVELDVEFYVEDLPGSNP